MRIAIFGTGGAGGYFGGRLAQAGEDVTFIARGEHLQAIRKDGLRVDSIQGDFAVQPAQATDDPAEAGVVDAVLLGVKTWQVKAAAEAMRPLVGAETVVLPFNGQCNSISYDGSSLWICRYYTERRMFQVGLDGSLISQFTPNVGQYHGAYSINCEGDHLWIG